MRNFFSDPVFQFGTNARDGEEVVHPVREVGGGEDKVRVVGDRLVRNYRKAPLAGRVRSIRGDEFGKHQTRTKCPGNLPEVVDRALCVVHGGARKKTQGNRGGFLEDIDGINTEFVAGNLAKKVEYVLQMIKVIAI
jgi:hypothetical protein